MLVRRGSCCFSFNCVFFRSNLIKNLFPISIFQIWRSRCLLETDHLSGAKEAKKMFGGGTIGIGACVPSVQKVFKSIFDLNITCDGSQFDRLFKDGDEFKIGDLPVKVLATPGHTPACVTYVVNDEAVFVGDTIFAEVTKNIN